MKNVLYIVLLVIVNPIVAQRIIRVERLQNAPITGVVADSKLDVVIHLGDTPGVVLEVDDRLESYLECNLSPEGILSCRYSKVPSLRWKGSARPDSSELKYVAEGNVDPRGGRMYRRGRMIVTVETLKNLVLKDDASLVVEDPIHTDSCKIELRGKPRQFRMLLDARRLELYGKYAVGLKHLAGSVEEMYAVLKYADVSLPRLDVEQVSGTLFHSMLRCTASRFDMMHSEDSHYTSLR